MTRSRVTNIIFLLFLSFPHTITSILFLDLRSSCVSLVRDEVLKKGFIKNELFEANPN